MKKKLIIIAVVAAAIALGSAALVALPRYTQETGRACGHCHVDPAGGPELTEAGKYYAANRRLPQAQPAAPGAGPTAQRRTIPAERMPAQPGMAPTPGVPFK